MIVRCHIECSFAESNSSLFVQNWATWHPCLSAIGILVNIRIVLIRYFVLSRLSSAVIVPKRKAVEWDVDINCLHVSSLLPAITDEDLTHYFSTFGDFANDSAPRKVKQNFALLTYSDSTSVEKVLSSAPHFIRERSLRVRLAYKSETQKAPG